MTKQELNLIDLVVKMIEAAHGSDKMLCNREAFDPVECGSSYAKSNPPQIVKEPCESYDFCRFRSQYVILKDIIESGDLF